MPVNINLLPDEVIARGITPPDVGNFGTSLAATQNYLQQQAERNLFQDGRFIDPTTGQIDTGRLGEALLRLKGVEALPTVLQLQNLQVRRGLPTIESLQSPSQPAYRPTLPPTSQGSGVRQTAPAADSGTVAEAGGETLPPGKGNLGPVSGVDYGPVETTPFPATKVATVPAGSAGAMPAPQFAPTPTNAPATDRFADHPVPRVEAQRVAQVPTQAQPPGQPDLSQLEAEAVRQDQISARALQASKDAGYAGAAGEEKAFTEVSKQAADRAKQLRDRLGKITEEREKSRLKQETTLPEAVTKAQVESIVKSSEEAKTLQQAVPTTQNLFNQLNSKSGLFSGAWAQEKLQLAKIAASVGFSADPRITPTETYQAEIGRRVGRTVKLFGSGTSITNQDREYAEKMEGGQIKLDENSMRRILELADRGARDTIREHNARLDTMIKAYPPQYRGQLELFRVEAPPPITGRTTGAKAPPPGALPPAPVSDEDRTNGQLYRTPGGVMRWNRTTAGTGWTPP